MKRLLHAFLLSFIPFVYAHAQQTSCAQNLRLARATYEQGRLHEVPTYIQSCIQSGSTQEKVEAYKLLCLTYIYLEEPEKADDAMLNILRTDHYFTVDIKSDPAEFVALYRSFRTTEIYRVGVSMGINASQPNVASTLQTISTAQSKFSYKIALQFGALFDLPINKYLTLNSGVNFQQRKFELTSKNDQGDGDLNTLIATETQTYLGIPVVAQYEPIQSKFNPYVGIGFSASMLLNDNLTVKRSRDKETAIDDKTFDIQESRNRICFDAILSLGSKTRLGGGYIIADIKYLYGLSKINNDENTYNNQDLYLSYGMPNTIFKLNSLSFTIGYVYNIFNPKKLKK